MKRAGVGVFAAMGGAGGSRRAATGTDQGAPVGAKRRYLVELQWLGKGGRFRHVALIRPPWRRLLVTFGSLALFAILVVAVAFSGSHRAPSSADLDNLLRRNAELKARQAALHESALEVIEQLFERIELGRKLAWTADTPVHAWEVECPRPPARDAGTEALLAWLSDQSERLESLGGELTAGREEDRREPSTAPAREGTVAMNGGGALHSAAVGSAQHDEAASPQR